MNWDSKDNEFTRDLTFEDSDFSQLESKRFMHCILYAVIKVFQGDSMIIPKRGINLSGGECKHVL